MIFDKTLPEQIKPADNSSADAPKDLHCFFTKSEAFVELRQPVRKTVWPVVIDKDFMSRRWERFFLVSAVIGRQNVSKLRAGFKALLNKNSISGSQKCLWFSSRLFPHPKTLKALRVLYKRSLFNTGSVQHDADSLFKLLPS